MTPTELDTIEAEFKACRKPAASERWAMSHGQRLIDELRDALRDREAMDVLRTMPKGEQIVVSDEDGWYAGTVIGSEFVDCQDPADALFVWADQQAAKGGAE